MAGLGVEAARRKMRGQRRAARLGGARRHDRDPRDFAPRRLAAQCRRLASPHVREKKFYVTVHALRPLQNSRYAANCKVAAVNCKYIQTPSLDVRGQACA